MSRSLRADAASLPLLRQEPPRPVMAKAEMRPLLKKEKREKLAGILRRASQIAGLSRKETAAKLDVDDSQLGKWWDGDENAQVHLYFNDAVLREAFRLAEAEAAEHDGQDVRVRWVIEVGRRRSA